MNQDDTFFNLPAKERVPGEEWDGPDMAFHLNLNDKLCLCLRGWDTPESVEGFTFEEIGMLIEMLNDAKKIIIDKEAEAVQEMKQQGTFNWEKNQ
jgi:hypothetical protein